MINEAKQLKAFIKRKIDSLSGNETANKAMLANLRRGIGKEPGSIPILWEATLSGMPESLSGKYAEPSYGEWAAHTALTLYALHQHGKERCMSDERFPLGKAVRMLVKNDEDENRIKRRLDAAVTADSLQEVSHHLRGIVQLLKSADIPLCYPSLAEDIYLFQFSTTRDSVRLHWGRDFYRIGKNEENYKA